VSRVGLVLGGGGITGAAYEMAALMAIELATGWDPNEADAVVGTSAGSFVAALVRNEALTLDSVVKPGDDREAVTERIRSHVFVRGDRGSVGRWIRRGIVPGVRSPGLTLFLGAPAPYNAGGVGDWVTSHIGAEAAKTWPERPTAIVAHDLDAGERVAFGTSEAPVTAISDAVSASSAIPLVFSPYRVDGRFYVDGGISSGTHADLILGWPEPLDLVLIIAPMATEVQRRRAMIHERVIDRVGTRSLSQEKEMIREAWPHADVVTLTPSPTVQNVSRPNPMDPSKSVPTFMRTLISMKRALAKHDVWGRLERHLVVNQRDRTAAAR